MRWTAEQQAILAHPTGEHALVRAAPGSGKTTTLVGRVEVLVRDGVAPSDIRVVMFNRSVAATFRERLTERGIDGVLARTFDALGLEVLRAAERRGLTTRPLVVRGDALPDLARAAWREFRGDIEDPDEITRAVAFWKAHVVPPDRAAFPENPAVALAYRRVEEMRREGDAIVVTFEDMVYTAVAVLRRHASPLAPFRQLLVDEFQDTNPGRVELMQRLGDVPIMVVGDEDQAINEWCGANPGFLQRFEEYFPRRPTRRYPLSRSFRLGAALATAADRVIARNTTRTSGTITPGGAVPGRIERVEDAAATVLKLLGDGIPASGIAVLYRGRSQGAATLAALIAARVPIDTEDLALLRRGRGPELALAYLHYATSDAPPDFEKAWRMVHAPERYIRKDAFRAMLERGAGRGLQAILGDRSLARACGQAPGAIESMTDLSRLLGRMGRARTAGEALALLEAEVDVEEQLRTWIRTEKEQEVAIATFTAVSLLFAGFPARPSEAVETLDALDPTLGRALSECVRVTTIHKAKGLEWPHVVLPALAEGFCPARKVGSVPGTTDRPEGVQTSDWMEEERRIFYVGLTRAMEAAYLQVPKEDPSRFVAECLGPPARPARPSRPKGIDELVRGALPEASGRKWTEEDDDLALTAWDGGDTIGTIAERLGRSRSAIAARLVRLGAVATREEARQRG